MHSHKLKDLDQEIQKSGSGKFSEDEKELVKQIVIHEAYSAAYKLKLAAVVIGKGTKIVGKAAVKGGQALKKKWDVMRKNKKAHKKR